MGDSMMLLDIVMIGFGVYMLYATVIMIKKREINQNILVSKDVNVKDCKDKEGYINYMTPRLFIFSVVVLLNGILGIMNTKLRTLDMVYVVVLGLTFITFVFFIISLRKAYKKYF